jgi:MFS family permease
MTPAAATYDETRPATVGLGAGVVGLLALSIFINYVDRGNLATAAPLIKDQLHLTNTQIGLLVSAFFWTYVPGQLLSGWLAERINAYRTLALGVALWSLATAATGLATGFASLFALRLLLGLGESAGFPCSSKLLAQHLPADRLGGANGLIAVGLALGPAFGTLTGGMLMAHLGWRPVFILFGLVSALWLLPWRRATRHASARADTATQGPPPPSFMTILKEPAMWGAGLGHFTFNYGFYFVISWLPLYLVKARGFTLPQMAELGGVIYVVYAISAQATGWLSDRWMASGATGTRVRKTFLVTAHVGLSVCMLACAVGGPIVSIISLLTAGVFFGFSTATVYAVGQILGGPRAGGKWIGVQNCIGNSAGIVAPIVTGFVVDRTGHFSLAFMIAAALALIGALGWGVIIRRVAPVAWPEAVRQI